MTLSWIATGILLLVVYSVSEFIYRYRVTSRGTKKILTRLPLPLIGNALHFVQGRSTSGMFNAMCSYLPGSPISAVWLGPQLMVMIADAKLANTLLVKGIASKKADLYSVFDHASDGVFVTRDVKKWASLRKPLDKLMEPKWVKTWIEIFNRNADLFCEAIDKDADEFQVPFRTFEYSLSNLAETHLGLQNWESFLHLGPALFKDMEEMIALLMMRMWDITIKPNALFRMTKCFSEYMQVKLRTTATYNQLLEARKTYLREKNLDVSELGCYTDVIIFLAKQLNCDEDETFKLGIDFIVTGAHTTSFTLASVILFLAMFPECQKKIYEETRTVCGESTGAPTEEQLNRLEYLDMVIKETLRHAGVPGVSRHLEQEVELDGYVIPKNSILWFDQMLLNYNPKYWERPKEFYPEHFTPEAEAARPKGAFLPFSLGARSCPGRLYAKIELKVALSKAVQQFEFFTNQRFEDVEFTFSVLRSPSVYDVVAKRRTTLN